MAGTRVARQTIFVRDYVYLFLSSVQGCRVSITLSFKGDARMPSRPRGDGKAAAGEGGASPRGSKQTGMNPNDKEADLDFNTFNLGNGPLTEKKKRLAAYV